MPRFITLTTDFGPSSPYVAQMKGVILSLNPAVTIVDISHAIPPQDVRGGALALDAAARWFPDETIHVAVVDPGVGTERRLVYARIGSHHFLAPNNGLLGLVARRESPARIIALHDSRYWMAEVSPTFNGRDILAPVAAHLSLGIDAGQLGPPLGALVPLDWPEIRVSSGELTGCIVAIDSFGNLISNIVSTDLQCVAASPAVRTSCRGQIIEGLVKTYGNCAPGALVALVGSSGRLELAVVNGSASGMLGVQVGEEVVVTF